MALGFALVHGDYQEFLTYDFGWEDRFFLIGKSKPEKEFPYILPGPDDKWGGTRKSADFGLMWNICPKCPE